LKIISFQKRSYERFGICGAAFALFCCSCLRWEPLASVAAFLVERSNTRKFMDKKYQIRSTYVTVHFTKRLRELNIPNHFPVFSTTWSISCYESLH